MADLPNASQGFNQWKPRDRTNTTEVFMARQLQSLNDKIRELERRLEAVEITKSSTV